MSSAEVQEFIAATKALADNEVSLAAADWSTGASPSENLYRKAAELGLTGIEVPKNLGGRGFDFDVKVAACEALASADFGFAMSLVNTHNVALRLCLSAAETVRDQYLPALLDGSMSACTALTEPAIGSDFGAITTHAHENKDGWALSGEKKWIVNARHAGLAIVFAQCLEPGNRDGIGAFVVDLHAPGVKRYAIDSAFSQTGIGTGGFTLDNTQIDSDHLLLAPGTAFKSILNEINGARTYVAAMCNAMLERALQEVRTYGEQRHTFGKPLSAHESWQQSVRNAEADLQKVLLANYCFTRHLAAAQIAGFTDGATNLLRDRAAMLKAT